MSTFLHRLTPSTLQRIRDELIGSRFLDRDMACAARQCCKDCEFYGTLEARPTVVVPAEGKKPGWLLIDTPQPDEDHIAVKGTSQDADADSDPEPTAKEESQSPDSADLDDPLI